MLAAGLAAAPRGAVSPLLSRGPIVHILAPAAFGGLERVVRALAEAQCAAGAEVHAIGILDPGQYDHPVLRSLAAAGVQVHPVTVPARRYGRERAAVRAILARIRPAIVHTHGYRADVLHGGAARSAGAAAVATVHGFTGGDWKNRMYERLQCRRLRNYDAVVAVSEPLSERLARTGIPRDRLHVIRNAHARGAELMPRNAARAALDVAPTAFCVAFVGRLGHEKGPDLFLDALAKADPEIVAVVLGAGPMGDALRAHPAAGRVRWAGIVSEAERLFAAFDALVISSRTEGTPMVLLEAMAAGVPVVSTRVGGIPDVVSEAEVALVDAGDVAGLAAAMDSVLRDRDAARERASRARARLEAERGIGPWLEGYGRVYEVASTRKSKGAQ